MLIFDGDCAFCRRSAAWGRRHVNPNLPMQAWQESDLDALGLTTEQCRETVQWVETPSRSYSGGAAICAALRTGGWQWRTVGAIGNAPGIRVVTESIYRWVARNRHRF